MKTQEEIRKFLDKKIAEKGTNYRELSLAIGRKDQYIHQYIRYGLPQQLKEDDRRAIARILDVDEQELSSKPLFPPISPLHSDGISVLIDQATKFISNLRKKNIDTISIDMLDAVACCGTGIENLNENVNGKWLMPLIDFRQITMSAPENIKMIKSNVIPINEIISDVAFSAPPCRRPRRQTNSMRARQQYQRTFG